jgi:hypothetical protein
MANPSTTRRGRQHLAKKSQLSGTNFIREQCVPSRLRVQYPSMNPKQNFEKFLPFEQNFGKEHLSFTLLPNKVLNLKTEFMNLQK